MPILLLNYHSLQIKFHEKNAIKWATKLSVKKASEIEIGEESSK